MSYLEKLKSKMSLPQALPLLPKAKNEENMPMSGTALTALTTLGSKGSSRGTHISENKPLQQQFDSLWEKAWKLADWIDEPESDIPWQERAAKVPELQEMSAELDRLEAIIKAEKENTITPEPLTEDYSNSLEGFSPLPKLPEPKQHHMDSCPAKCKTTGKCYGIAYFDAKPGKALLCIPDKCPWSGKLKQNLERNKK